MIGLSVWGVCVGVVVVWFLKRRRENMDLGVEALQGGECVALYLRRIVLQKS